MLGTTNTILGAVMAAMFLLAGCEPKPQPIQYGSDQCEYCRMMVTDPEFGSQVLNVHGRSFKFDSVECMAAYVLTVENRDNLHSYWVPDFLNRGEWIDAESAVYLKSETLRSPMGLFLSSYQDVEAATSMAEEYGGDIISFDQVLDLVQKQWLENNNSIGHMHHE